MTIKKAIYASCAAIGLLGLLLTCAQLRVLQGQHLTREASERAIAKLPPGVESAWLRFIDQRLDLAIHAHGSTVSVLTILNGVTGESELVSINTPFEVNCSPIMGGNVSFGLGESQILVPIYGPLLTVKGIREPNLPVRKDSIAAKNLSMILCDRIADRLGRIMATR
ncbi:MAG TPA: hypothetical protein VG891_04780 [Rhizomicrobium sp.]|nr:hypothetical protein [Rhizomicrobium sp.]